VEDTNTALVEPIRDASRRLVRELGFLRSGLANLDLPPSTVHALLEIDARDGITAAELGALLGLEKSSVSRMLRKLVAAGEVAERQAAADARAKPLSLTARGRATAAAIHGFARRQVTGALGCLDPARHGAVVEGLRLYADALAAARGAADPPPAAVTIASGYRVGALGRCSEIHARFYAREAGFGVSFEAMLASGLAEFSQRLHQPCNGIWLALQAGHIVGTVAVDGEDLGPGVAHLRWFIVEDAVRGGGVGRRLLSAAIAFCEAQSFDAIHLWTFHGLDAARHLYEAHGFDLAEERPGRQWGTEVLEQRFVRPTKKGA